jgi:hypothetical protein
MSRRRRGAQRLRNASPALHRKGKGKYGSKSHSKSRSKSHSKSHSWGY